MPASQAGLRAVTRQQLRLALGDFGELVFKGVRDAGVKRVARLAQQRAIGRVLHQGMLEQIAGLDRLRHRGEVSYVVSRSEDIDL
jgi:hypothetical protein